MNTDQKFNQFKDYILVDRFNSFPSCSLMFAASKRLVETARSMKEMFAGGVQGFSKNVPFEILFDKERVIIFYGVYVYEYKLIDYGVVKEVFNTSAMDITSPGGKIVEPSLLGDNTKYHILYTIYYELLSDSAFIKEILNMKNYEKGGR